MFSQGEASVWDLTAPLLLEYNWWPMLVCLLNLFCPAETKTSIEAFHHLLHFIYQVLIPYQCVPEAIFLTVCGFPCLHLSGGRLFARAMSPSIWWQSRPASKEWLSQRFTARDERTARGSLTRWTT